jgi:hypothetical protein
VIARGDERAARSLECSAAAGTLSERQAAHDAVGVGVQRVSLGDDSTYRRLNSLLPRSNSIASRAFWCQRRAQAQAMILNDGGYENAREWRSPEPA